jgi:hypothetical protein
MIKFYFDQTLKIDHNQKNSHAGCHIDDLGLIEICLLCQGDVDDGNAEKGVAGGLETAG